MGEKALDWETGAGNSTASVRSAGYAIAPVVFTVSSIKWIISIAAFLYALPALVTMLIRLPSLLR